MEEWEDKGVVLSVRPHGDNGAIVSILTDNHGRYAGYVYGGQSSKNRGNLEIGNIVYVEWKSRVQDSLGQYKIEMEQASASLIMENRLALQCLQSACAIADYCLPERENCLNIAEATKAFINVLKMENEVFLPAYIYWEIGLLREMGFGLDFSSCALSGETKNLAYVSPKTGRAATLSAGEEYKNKLLKLPKFLSDKANIQEFNYNDALDGFILTAYFLKHKLLAQTYKDIPKARYMLQELIEQKISFNSES